jgi:Tfp pilus assembly protein PilE
VFCELGKEQVMRNQKGVTLISLIATIIVMIILAAITTVTSMNTYNEMKLESFKAELEEVQKKVNEIAADYEIYSKKNGEETSYSNYFSYKFNGSSPALLSENSSNLTKARTNVLNVHNEIDDSSNTVFYFTEADIQKFLNLKGIDDIIVDFSIRQVYSVEGCKDPENSSTIYYTPSDYGENTVIYEAEVSSSLSSLDATSTLKTVVDTKMAQITLTINRSTESNTKDYPISKVYYSKDSGSSWIEVTNFTISGNYIKFVLYEEGTYSFKVTDSSGAFVTTSETEVTLSNETET